MLANIDPYILAFSAFTVAATIWMGFRSAKKSKTASDFFVAGRSVSVGWNASAISGEYLSAASFMGIAGMVMSAGYDALWYPVCYACGYLFLLLFIAGPLRRFGAYTIPDFAEGRFDSPVFRKIAVVFVLFIGFFYTMPQMKGAGTTLAYIFQDVDLRGGFLEFLAPHSATGEALKGFPYWAGVLIVGAVITLNVALGGMKGITLVQAFQYWAKMFAISVPIFVLMAVYGHYGKQVGVNGGESKVMSPATESLIPINNLVAQHEATQFQRLKKMAEELWTRASASPGRSRTDVLKAPPAVVLFCYGALSRTPVLVEASLTNTPGFFQGRSLTISEAASTNDAHLLVLIENDLMTNDIALIHHRDEIIAVSAERYREAMKFYGHGELGDKVQRQSLPAKAPADATWLNPFGPLTTKAAKNAAAAIGKKAEKESREGAKGAKENASSGFANFAASRDTISLRSGLSPGQHMTVNLDSPSIVQALGIYSELTGRKLLPNTNSLPDRVDDLLGGKLSELKLIARTLTPDSGVREHADGPFTAAEVKKAIEAHLRTNGIALVAVGANGFVAQRSPGVPPGQDSTTTSGASIAYTPARQDAGGAAEKAWLAKHEKPLALLYTYSLIIAIVCGTAGLPHILVRFYTNPDGAAAKRTTMWVMILIGIFYVFPPVFGVIGRNLMPELYSGVGAKGTDKIVLELPRLLNAKYPPLGSILSGITCAGAFAAFMSTFSGLLVSMTGALAHDVYGRILRPKATAEERMRMFKIGAVIIGGVAILLGSFVEKLEINFMVGQAFAIAASSYFPLLFMAVWWRKLTMRGAATGMLTGGLLAVAAISLTSFSTLAAGTDKLAMTLSAFKPLNTFWAEHPLLRIICEQPAIWAVPLAIILMIIVSKLTAKTVPADSRMKMLVLHAPEELGLKHEYIQEHQAGH